MDVTRPENIVCVIPCAGKGTRMQPLTYTRPKPLLPVCNQPTIGHILEAVAGAGITQACLIVSPDHEQLAAYLAGNTPSGLSIECVVQEEPKGLGHAVLCAGDFVGERPFIVYLGDSIYGDRIRQFVERFACDWPKGLLRLQKVAEPQHYGIAVLDEAGRATKVVEKPDHAESDLAITGVYGFRPSFFGTLAGTPPGKGGEIQVTDAIQQILHEEPGVWGEVYQGLWADCGRPSQFLAANAALLAGLVGAVDPTAQVVGPPLGSDVRIGPDSLVHNTTFRGSVLIGRGCRLTNATISGPCAINDGAVIADSVIHNAIIDERARIQGLRGGVWDSIIGTDAELRDDGGNGSLSRAVVGDGSCIRFG
jgi:glucose-1-phosphate thymidylyltransferase